MIKWTLRDTFIYISKSLSDHIEQVALKCFYITGNIHHQDGQISNRAIMGIMQEVLIKPRAC